MTAVTVTHNLATEYIGNGARVRRVCPCGYESQPWVVVPGHPNLISDPNGCPNDDTIRSLVTLQFASGGLVGAKPVDGWAVHLVRRAHRGTPGPTLCGIDRFAPGSAGWSVGGGVTGPGIKHTPCAGCVEVAARDFPGLPVSGSVGRREIAAALAAVDV